MVHHQGVTLIVVGKRVTGKYLICCICERTGGIFPCRPRIPPIHPHQYLCVCPVNWHWHKPDGVSRTVSVCPGFHGPY